MNNKTYNESIYEDADKYWVSSDMFIAATLIALHHKLISIEWQDHRKATFIFKHSKSLTSTVEQYFSDKLTLNPRELFDAQRLLKSRLYVPNR
ncbi:MAG: hypothetical protein HYV32_03070 [Candidatus Kerfeldbacteria bacterium]|nr:hypothetical protein [Candidatus Kerfeldbacteria bacterium]